MPICFVYNPASGEFVGTVEADESPLEPGVFLDPAFSTRTSPPAAQAGFARVCRDGAWTTVPDHRGETWWRGHEAVVIADLGNPADGGLEPVEPPPAPSPIPDRCTKLGLKRALAEAGPLAVFPEPEWPAIRAALASSPDLQEDWDLATEIRRVDPLTQTMIAVRGYSPATVDALLVRANEIVA